MFDYLFSFPDEATAHAALAPLGLSTAGTDGDGKPLPPTWDASRCLPVTLSVGDVAAQGYWLVVSSAEPWDDLYAIPYCMREADRDKALAGKPYVTRERFTAEQLAAPWSISPQWCGVSYSNAGAVPAPVSAVAATVLP